MSVIRFLCVLTILASASLSWSSESEVLKPFSSQEISSARAALKASLEQKDFSLEQLREKITNLKILNIEEKETGWGRIWCSPPKNYEITVQHPLAAEKQWTVRLTHYRPRKWHRLESDQKKTVLISPATGGQDELEKNHAFYLCDWKIVEAIRLAGWGGDGNVNAERTDVESEIAQLIQEPSELDIKTHDRGAVLNIVALAVAAAFANHINPELDPERPLGILGNSVGGIAAGLAMAMIPQIRSGVLIVAGTPTDQVIATSDERRLSALRQTRMALLGLNSIQEYIGLLSNHVHLDSARLSSGLKGKKLIMVTAGKDTTVPFANQKSMLKHFTDSGAEVEEIHDAEKNHRESIVGTLLSTRRLSILGDFFKSTL